MANGDARDIACGHRRRFEEDLDLAVPMRGCDGKAQLETTMLAD